MLKLSRLFPAAMAVMLLSASAAFCAPGFETIPGVDITAVLNKVPHFSMVTAKLARGAQPKVGGLEALQRAGFKTVINLRAPGDDATGEEKEAKSAGLNYISMPLKHSQRIPQKHIDKFLATVKDPQMQPVFIHCKMGMDRTGAMVALYRIDQQGWTPKRSYQEMLSQGFHPLFRNLTKSVFAFASGLGKVEPLPPITDLFRNLFYGV